MIARLIGAVLRAILVVMLIATPALMLPGTTEDIAQIVTLVAIFAAALTIFEYASSYPGLVEFRDAPPFNRIRYLSLFATVFLLSTMARGTVEPTNLTILVESVGRLIGSIIDFPYSPVRLVVLMLPPDSTVAEIETVRSSAGIAYLISLFTLTLFLIIQRLISWPLGSGSFNVWVNLPTFDPTAGGDVVERLSRDARFNIALGFLLPFVMPTIVNAASSLFGAITLDNPHTLIWTVAAWAFLPASLFMRGIAMGRIASMIREKRRRAADDADLLTV
ncbi:MAG: hypothetical protein AAF871_11005 [Pseudomonadota bacterium]